MAPNINNPGGVKNDPDEIRDGVVSDATRFPGADIDAAISSRASPADTGLGIDWSSKTPRVDIAGTRNTGSILSVSGSGYILEIVLLVDTVSSGMSVSIDGTTLYTQQDGKFTSAFGTGDGVQSFRNDASGSTVRGLSSRTSGLFRFDSSFTVTNNSGEDNQVQISYVLD